MAFIPVGSLDGAQSPFEYYLMTDNEGCALGQGLTQSSGRLTSITGQVAPEFVAMATQAAEASSVTPVPVIRVREDQEFKATSTATVAVTLVGAKVNTSTDGLNPTATSTGAGVFEISRTDGTTTNSNVRGYFRR